MDEPEKRRFLWGVSLAWVPCVPFLLGVVNSFKGISEQKATGLGALAGELAEAFVISGLAATLLFEIGAIVLLIRSFSRGHRLRSAFAAISICLSALMVSLLGLYVWFVMVYSHHAS